MTSPVEPGYVAPGMHSSDVPSSRARLDLLDPLEVSKLGGLELITEGVVEGFLSGLHRSPRRGFSVEFADAYLAMLATTVDRSAQVTDGVERLLGRSAESFAQWVAEHKEWFTN